MNAGVLCATLGLLAAMAAGLARGGEAHAVALRALGAAALCGAAGSLAAAAWPKVPPPPGAQTKVEPPGPGAVG